MSDSEPFLNRWSRRKREAVQGVEDAAAERADAPVRSGDERAADGQPTVLQQPDVPAIDLDKLPPLDSITAETDIRGFLQPGVPSDLSHAALRRAWSADPSIRDFIGLVENHWDFNDPHGVPGFGPMSLDDVARAAAEIFGEHPVPPAGTGSEPKEATSESASDRQCPVDEDQDRQETPLLSVQGPTATGPDIVQSKNEIAMHNAEAESRLSVQPTRRRQGRALPQ